MSSRSRRGVFLLWLRRTHLYVGLWGAALGLLFGATGILLNHRAVMKIPVEKAVLRTAQMPAPALASVAEMSAWLRRELGFTAQQVVLEKAQPPARVVWAGRELTQPERWTVSLHSPRKGVNAEYFVGNRFVRLDHIDATPIGTLTRLHMSTGATPFWILLADTIAGSLILLSITGLLLWTQLNTVRTAAVLTAATALVGACALLWMT